jgi:hypothetical protein
LAKFYLEVLSLPSEPIPVPFVANILYKFYNCIKFFSNFLIHCEVFRGTKRHPSVELIELSKKYGTVFTFWMGPKPFVIIFDRDIARETFRKNEFA